LTSPAPPWSFELDARSAELGAELDAQLRAELPDDVARAAAVGAAVYFVSRHPTGPAATLRVWRDGAQILARVVTTHPQAPPEDPAMLKGGALKRALARHAHPPEPKPYASGALLLATVKPSGGTP